MRDAAMALPLITRLAERAKSDSLYDEHFENACKNFEDEMIPRTFEWVKKSGGDVVIVSLGAHACDKLLRSLTDLKNSLMIQAKF
jgi:hypothetical protein